MLSNKTFKGSVILRATFVFAVITTLLMSWSFRNIDHDAIWLHIFSLMTIVLVFLVWPRTIHFDEEGIWQRDRIGRIRRIQWTEVDSLVHAVEDRKTIVAGGSVEIAHGMFHSDKELFCEFIQQRTAHKLAFGMWPER